MPKPCEACGFANYDGMERCAQCGRLLAQVQGTVGVREAGGEPGVAKGRDPLLAGLLSFLLPGAGQMYNEQVLKGEVILVTSFLLLPWLYGIVDAYQTAGRLAPAVQIRSPGLAALLGHVLPGAGQAYNRQWGKAILVFLTSPLILPWVLGIVDANRTAKRINAGMLPLPPLPSRRSVVTGLLLVLAALALLIWLLASRPLPPTVRFPI